MVPVLVLFAIYLGISYILTPENADSMLAGYNTLSDERKAKYDIVKTVNFQNKMLRLLAAATLILGGLAFYFEIAFLYLFTLIYLPFILIMGAGIYGRLRFSTDPFRWYDWLIYGAIIIFLAFITYQIPFSGLTIADVTQQIKN